LDLDLGPLDLDLDPLNAIHDPLNAILDPFNAVLDSREAEPPEFVTPTGLRYTAPPAHTRDPRMDAATTIATDMGIGPGDVVAGKDRVVRVIGHGGMGVVVEAVHEALEQRVAIKFLRPEVGAHDEAVTRFLMEAKALARFKSLHVAKVTDISTAHEAMPYFVMEYLDGHDLASALAVDGTLSVIHAVDYALQVCEALAEAYTAGIVHRDIKPSNLFLTKGTDGSTLVKLLDFGISKHTGTTETPELSMTRTSALMGSPRYMAPEQMRAMKRVDHRADIWSLGVVLHESLTGHPPFVGETLPEVCAAIAADDPVRVRQLRRDVPIELQDVILRCLAKDPAQRYKDVSELANELAPFASPDAAVTARRISRIIVGPSMVPPPMMYASPVPAAPPSTEGLDYVVPHETFAAAPLAARPHPDAGRRRFRRWALISVAVMAVPAFILAVLVFSSPSGPEVRTAPASSATTKEPPPATSRVTRPRATGGSGTAALE
jgi:tRNA A-37 threonylcarbamoyl transferase component Bud32